jgi:hypothetical protein
MHTIEVGPRPRVPYVVAKTLLFIKPVSVPMICVVIFITCQLQNVFNLRITDEEVFPSLRNDTIINITWQQQLDAAGNLYSRLCKD